MSLADQQATLTNAIAEYYITHGKECSTQQIAEVLSWPPAKVRKVILSGPGGGLPYVREEVNTAPKASRDYPMWTSGVKRFYVYSPTREFLRKIILTSRMAAEKKDT